MNQTKISKYISIGVRVTALLLILFFFLPSICVSCSGVEVKVSGFNASTGTVNLDDLGEEFEDLTVEAAPWLLIALALAIVIAIVANKLQIVSIGCAIGGVIMMIAYKIGVDAWVDREFAEMASMISVKTNAVYAFYIIFCILIAAALAFEKFVLLNDVNRAKVENLLVKFNIIRNSETPVVVPAAPEVNKIFCPNCGKPNKADSSFCSECGTALPVSSAPESKSSSNQ